MVMQLNQPIKAGEQVFLDYGKISAQNWLINYGMIDPALVKEPGNIQVWVPKELSVSSNKMKLLQHFPLLKGKLTILLIFLLIDSTLARALSLSFESL